LIERTVLDRTAASCARLSARSASAAAIAPGNATTGTITFPLTVAWGGLEKTEEGECHERKQILGQEPGLAFTAA
jgi:hypothetical protein